MSDGLLKKRILDLVDYPQQPDFAPEDFEKELTELLREVSKEFPVDDMPNSTPDHEMLLRLVKLNRERLNWRLIWLGEPK